MSRYVKLNDWRATLHGLSQNFSRFSFHGFQKALSVIVYPLRVVFAALLPYVLTLCGNDGALPSKLDNQ